MVPNQLLKHYCILKALGKGGFGTVYKAEDTRRANSLVPINQLVAIKEMIQVGLSPQEVIEASKAFEREARFLASLIHPHLPRIYDYFEEAGNWYLVMDFIEGETLHDYLDKAQGKKLQVKEVLEIGIQLCTVLSHLHTRQPPIIFRDLKPLNVMRTPDGHLYLIDFGIARHFKPGQTKDTASFISIGYAAPEQYGRAQTTIQSDIYSLGAMLHQSLTGNDPAANTPTLFDFPPLRLHNQPSPAGLETLIMQMVEKVASKRPASAKDIKQQLQRIDALLSASPPAALPPKPPLQPAPLQPLVQPQAAPPRPANIQPAPVIPLSPIKKPPTPPSPPPPVQKPVAHPPLPSVNVWRIGKRELVTMVVGIVVLVCLSTLEGSILSSSPGDAVATIIVAVLLAGLILVTPQFFGVIFGPWVGLFTGGVGSLVGIIVLQKFHFYGSSLPVGPVEPYWLLCFGNALVGFTSGFTMFKRKGRYNIIRSLGFSSLGVIVGTVFATIMGTLIYRSGDIFILLGMIALIAGLIFLPIMLVIYSRIVSRI